MRFEVDTLSSLLGAGITVQDSLEIMLRDMESARERQSIERLLSHVELRPQLYAAMEAAGGFPDYAVNTVRLAEHSGNLESACSALAEYYESEGRRRAQIQGTVIYPFVLLVIMAVVIAFLVGAILPVFSRIYAQMGVDIRASQMARLASVIGTAAMAAVFAALGIFAIAFLVYQTKGGKRLFTKIFEVSHFTRRFSYLRALARFCSAFSLLLSSGDDVPTALSMAALVSGNSILKAQLDECSNKIKSGNALGDVLASGGIFGASHAAMVKTGIRAGTTERVMRRLGVMYEQDAERVLSRFRSLLEPALISVLSAVVGVMLFCIMLPLIGMMAAVG